jgi:beta-fructofuranosidase
MAAGGMLQNHALRQPIRQRESFSVGYTTTSGKTANGFGEDSKWLWGRHLAHPREVSARSDGTLRMDMAGGVLEMSNAGARGKSLAEIPRSMVVNSLAAMTVKDLQLSRAVASQEYCLSFKVDYADAAAFGLLLKYDDNMRGHKIRFEPVLGDLFSVVLYTDVAPLDDFWADLTGHHIPKLVDGPELQKHGQIRLDDAVSLVVADDIIELYAGGKVITYRLVRQDAHTTDAGGISGSHEGEGLVNGDQSKNPSTNGIQKGDGELHHLGFFVEDGKVSFRDISIGCRE